MIRIIGILVALLLLTGVGTVSATTLSDYLEAKHILNAMAACTASYNNRPGSLAVAAFERRDWKIEPFRKIGEKADAKYLLAWQTSSNADQDVYLLAVAGTEDLKDVKVDLRSSKVYFAGTTLAEFEANAARKDLPVDVPRVHEGFNQAAQELLKAETEQANDAKAGTIRLLSNILKQDREDKVYLVGHSLGGAVVTLLAARLLDLGVNPEQIEVITFGAPAVGNEEFVKKYEGKIKMTRIVIEGDPVPWSLRKVFGGYRHIGDEVVWRVSDPLQGYFSHNVPLYMDMALKNYYSKRRLGLKDGSLFPSEPLAGQPQLCVAAIKNSLPNTLQSEFAVMEEALWDQYDSIAPGMIPFFAAQPPSSSNMEKATAAGCKLLAVPDIQALRVRNDNTWYISLNQTVYRVPDGKVLNVGIYGGNTKVLTPMGALIHGASTMSQESDSWMKNQ